MFYSLQATYVICYSTSPYHIQAMDTSTPIRAVTFEPATKRLLFKEDTAHIQVFTARDGPLLLQLHCVFQL